MSFLVDREGRISLQIYALLIGKKLFLLSALSRLPTAQNNPYAKMPFLLAGGIFCHPTARIYTKGFFKLLPFIHLFVTYTPTFIKQKFKIMAQVEISCYIEVKCIKISFRIFLTKWFFPRTYLIAETVDKIKKTASWAWGFVNEAVF